MKENIGSEKENNGSEFSDAMSSYAKKMGLTNVGENPSSMLNVLGGKRGILETVLPGLLFMVSFVISNNLAFSLAVSVAVSVVMSVVRLLKKQTLMQALSGLFGVVICAVIANRTGRPGDYYVIGLVTNFVYFLVLSVSVLVRWPVVGLFLGFFLGENLQWRKVEQRLKVYKKATLVLAGVFFLRLLVQFPLWLLGESALVMLGTARILMGLPLYAAGLWFVWKIVSSVPKVEIGVGVEEGEYK